MVKCSECGFLAVRSKKDFKLDEASSEYRKSGVIAIGYDEQGINQHELHFQKPLCFAGVYDLSSEFDKETKGQNNTVSTLKVITKDRDCTRCTDWHQGFTPKEHWEMLDRQWERKWRIITGTIFVILAGSFTLLGAFIANLN